MLGGVIAGMVGGGSIVTFPAMVGIGLAPTVAVASNIVALTLSNISGVFADLKRMPSWSSSFKTMVLWSLLGSTIGAILLLITPERLFTFSVPMLMGAGTATFAFSKRIARWAGLRSDRE